MIRFPVVPLLSTAMLAAMALAAGPARAQTSPDGGTPGDAGESAVSKSTGLTIRIGDDDEQPVKHHHRHEGVVDRVNVGGPVVVKAGETVGDAVAVGGPLEVHGHVMGDAVAVGGALHVASGAHVEGDAVAVGGHLDVDDGATVDGNHIVVAPGMGLPALAGATGFLGMLALVWGLFKTLVGLLGLIALGALFVAFIPERLDQMKVVLMAEPGKSAAVGLLACIGIFPATLLLIITLVGILVVPFLWLAFGLCALLGLALIAQIIGERLLRGTKYTGHLWTLALGASVLSIVRLIPVLGSLTMIAAMVIGLGAVLLSRAGRLPLIPAALAPPPPAAADAPMTS